MPLTILAVFAHPDDEIGVGSTLARYGDAGVRTVLACATRGEAATIYCDACATRENLAEVRTHELACACQILGVGELRWLDWPDGEISALPRVEAVRQIVALIREVRPRVLLTHPENGLYPHPDHLAMWAICREAFSSAADPAEYPGTGLPWAVARLFTRAIPRSFFDASPAFAEYRVQLKGHRLPFIPTPDDEIDVLMQVAPWAERRMAAWDCHRSQHNPDGAFSQMPEEIRRAMAENEHFVLAAARVLLPDGQNDDLLAGLTGEEGSGEIGVGDASEFVARVQRQLSLHRTLIELAQRYLQSSPEPGRAEVFRSFAEGEQEVVYRMAMILRHAGAATGETEANAAIIAKGRLLSEFYDQVGLLLGQARASAAALEAEADRRDEAYWQELGGLVASQVSFLEHQ